jgi:hypothetical protein
MGFGQNLSADTFGGWKNHFQRMERWKQRCLAALEKDYGEEASCDVVDFALSYFVWCHSMREWLTEGNAIEQSVLDEDLKKHAEWKICRDIANRCRHYNLRMNPTDKDWSIGREFDPFATSENALPRYKIFLIFNDEKLELVPILTNTHQMWKSILSAHGLNLETINERFA